MRLRHAVLALSLATVACYDKKLTEAEIPSLRLAATADSAPADGATLVRVSAFVPADAASTRRTVTFTTNCGTFVDGGQTTAAITAIDSVAATSLRAPRTPCTARVRAQFEDVVEEALIQFDAAQPQRAIVQPGAFVVAAGSAHSVPVTAVLMRDIGQVTPGTQVWVIPVRADDLQPIGTVVDPLPSDTSGTVTTRFTAGDTSYRGDVYLRVTTLDGRFLGQGTVRVVDPPT